MKLIRENIINQVSEDYVVTSQIEVADISEIANAGYKSVICTRPNGEDPDQIDFEDIAQQCAHSGIECCKIEVTHLGITQDHLNQFIDAYANLPKPIFGYCRSGNRAATLYHMTAQLR